MRSFLLSCIVPFAFFLLPSAAAAAFSDVPENHPYYDAILFAQSRGIVGGYDDNTFRPEATINRAEFTKIIIASLYTQEEIDTCLTAPFRDVRRGAWFTAFVCLAHRQGIIEGYAENRFGPAKEINMAEAAVIITRALRLPRREIGEWYQPSVDAILEETDIVQEFFRPGDPLRRGEMAYIIESLRGKLPQHTPVSINIAELNRQEQINQIISQTNAERSKNGLPPLRKNALLMASAQLHAIDMEIRSYFSHNSPEGYGPEHRIKATGYMDIDFNTCNCSRFEIKVGENIAQGIAPPREIMDGWMASKEGHRENILSPDFQEIGVGLSASGEYWVQHFGAVKTE